MLQNLTKTLQHTDLLVPLADLPGELALLELRGALLVDVGEAQLGLQLPERHLGFWVYCIMAALWRHLKA